MANKAVVLGTNYYIGLSIIRCLGSKGIYTVAMDYENKNTYGAKSKYLSEQIIVPHYKKESEKLVEYLIEYSKKQDDKPVLFPSADQYVEFIDANLNKLREYYLIPMDKQGLWTDVIDKDTLYKMAIKFGVRVPETIDPKDVEFEKRLLEEVGFPCIVKPSDSPAFVAKFRKKIFLCNNREELDEALKKSKEAELEIMVQRIIPGFDDHMYTFDGYMDQESNVTHWTTCQKQRQYPINFGASVYTKQKYVPELYHISAPFFKKIGYKGFGEIEFKKDSVTGEYYFIEINARTTNFNAMLQKVGLNFPYICYMEMTGNKLDPFVVDKDKEVYFRYFQEDFLAIRDYIKTNQLRRNQVIKSLINKKAPAIWDIKDPKPSIAYGGMILKKILKKI